MTEGPVVGVLEIEILGPELGFVGSGGTLVAVIEKTFFNGATQGKDELIRLLAGRTVHCDGGDEHFMTLVTDGVPRQELSPQSLEITGWDRCHFTCSLVRALPRRCGFERETSIGLCACFVVVICA